MPAFGSQFRQQLRPKHRRFKRLAQAIGRPQLERAQFFHRFVRVRERGDDHEFHRRIVPKLAQQFEAFRIR